MLERGIVHIGLGAFHRAHQAPLFDQLARSGDPRWGVIGASLRSPVVRDRLQPQDYLYSLAIEDDRRRVEVVGAIVDVIVAREAPQRLIEAIASPQTRLVTVTVTEKGYKLDPASGLLMDGDPDVEADLSSLESPLTMPGYLAAGLGLRKSRGLAPITIISCDNIAGNGRKLREGVTRIAHAHDQALARWIDADCAFPNTMVDRIVPATESADIAKAKADLGFVDYATVRTEPFTQWVIEDCFVGERPDLEPLGVEFTSDVGPWEEAKLRFLNGAHSAMAYLGGLAGIETVDEFVAQPWGRAFVHLLWDDIEPSLDPHPQLELGHYRENLMRRFENKALGHRLVQIAMDGSQKIPQRLLPAALAKGEARQAHSIALAIAAWIRWQAGRDEGGHRFNVEDPLASTTARLLESATTPLDQVRAIFSIEAAFRPEFRANEQLQLLIAQKLEQLTRLGARGAVEQLIGSKRLAPEMAG